jgi:cytochrome c oxidase subunit 2
MHSFSISKSLAAAATLAAGVLVVIVILSEIGGRSDNPLTVDVFAKQYTWSFGYPGKDNAFSAGELHVPLGRQIMFQMHSQDVIHSFWVPEWRIKRDISPGTITTTIVSPAQAGTYRLICAQLCGIEHSGMRTKVVVESPADFRKWIAGLHRTMPAHLLELIRVDTDLESISRDTGSSREEAGA